MIDQIIYVGGSAAGTDGRAGSVGCACCVTACLSVLVLGRPEHAAQHQRPHRSLPCQATPPLPTRPAQATPGNRTSDTHHRVRTDRLDANGSVALRHGGKLYHIGIGRTHARIHVLLLVQNLHIRVTGELLRDLTLDPSRNYQPIRTPPGTPRHPPNRRTPNPSCRFGVIPIS
jgi:hypothetical protein